MPFVVADRLLHLAQTHVQDSQVAQDGAIALAITDFAGNMRGVLVVANGQLHTA